MNYKHNPKGRFEEKEEKSKSSLRAELTVVVILIALFSLSGYIILESVQKAYAYAEDILTADHVIPFATTTVEKTRRDEIEAELKPQYEKALRIAVEEVLIEEEKLLIEKKLEEVRAEKLQSPLP
jgi:hypothetical protein